MAELDGKVVGLYILHPNNVGRCGHIANASYGVSRDCRGRGVGRALVEDSLAACGALGFRLLQFNAVVASNLGPSPCTSPWASSGWGPSQADFA